MSTGQRGSRRRAVAVALPAVLALAGACAATAAAARSLDELLQEGYLIRSATHVSGTFHGCRRRGQVRFENGMTLYCSDPQSGYGAHPAAIVLAHPLTLDAAVLIGGQEYVGTIVDPHSYAAKATNVGEGPQIVIGGPAASRLLPLPALQASATRTRLDPAQAAAASAPADATDTDNAPAIRRSGKDTATPPDAPGGAP